MNGMKIYDKGAFAVGVIFACAIPLFVLNVISATWWQWLFTIALSVLFLYLGLSKSASERTGVINKNYKEVSSRVGGKYVEIKRNLPLIILVASLADALILRFAFDVYLPIWMYVVFLIALAIAEVYSFVLNREILKQIDDQEKERENENMIPDP
jgi:heme exporter protein D